MPGTGTLSKRVVNQFTQLFDLLGDVTRLRIVLLLAEHEELNVKTMCEILDESQPMVSYHLALLRVAKLIDVRRDGKHCFYHLCDNGFGGFVVLVVNMFEDNR